ncbi:unnamed protein product [Amoebophrya sp. A120]|nr:unnamed protein product [Amoebophrya sp. A120]|eukprot:GSA120T00019440001.1
MGFDFLQHCVMEDADETVRFLLQKQMAKRRILVDAIVSRFSEKLQEDLLPGMVIVDEDVLQLCFHYEEEEDEKSESEIEAEGGTKESDNQEHVSRPAATTNNKPPRRKSITEVIKAHNTTGSALSRHAARRTNNADELSRMWQQTQNQGRRATKTQELSAFKLAEQFSKFVLVDIFKNVLLEDETTCRPRIEAIGSDLSAQNLSNPGKAKGPKELQFLISVFHEEATLYLSLVKVVRKRKQNATAAGNSVVEAGGIMATRKGTKDGVDDQTSGERVREEQEQATLIGSYFDCSVVYLRLCNLDVGKLQQKSFDTVYVLRAKVTTEVGSCCTEFQIGVD